MRGDQRDHRGHARRRAADRAARRRRRARARRAAAAVRDHRDGTARRRRDRLRLGRRRDVRLRAGRRHRRATSPQLAQDVAGKLRALLVGAVVDRSAARRRRRPAPGGPQRAARALAGLLRAVLRSAGRRRGRRRRCCGRASRAGDADLGARFIAHDRSGALPGRRTERRPTCSRSAGSRAASTPNGCRAAPTRPPTPSSGRGGLADIEWTIQLLQLQHAGAGRRSCAPPARSTRCARRSTPGCSSHDAGRRAGHRVAAGDPAAQRDHARARQGRGPDPVAGHGRWSRSAARWATRRASIPGSVVDDYRRGPRGARARSSRRSSTRRCRS